MRGEDDLPPLSMRSIGEYCKLLGISKRPFTTAFIVVFLVFLGFMKAPSADSQQYIGLRYGTPNGSSSLWPSTWGSSESGSSSNNEETDGDEYESPSQREGTYGGEESEPTTNIGFVTPGGNGDFAAGTEERTWGSGQVQFIYLVGVEGAGHHGVAPLIEHMARYANMEFYMRHNAMRAAILSHSTSGLTSAFKDQVAQSPAGIKHVFLEDNSFPSAHYHRHSTFGKIKSDHHYDLEWIVKHARTAGANVKLLLLSRPFVNQVWSHKEWDGGFRGHASVLAKYMDFIGQELHRINEEPLWSRINYNWFSDELCPKVVPALAEFLEWPCPRDLVQFCSMTPFHISSKVPMLSPADQSWVDELQKSNAKRWGAYLRQDKAMVSDEELQG